METCIDCYHEHADDHLRGLHIAMGLREGSIFDAVIALINKGNMKINATKLPARAVDRWSHQETLCE